LSSDDTVPMNQRYPNRALITRAANSAEELVQSKRTVIASEATLEHGLQQKIDSRVESLDVACSVARSGPRCGVRCAIDAIYAMLVALVSVNSKTNPHAESCFRTVLQRLSGVEAESLDHMQHHLEENGGLGSACDWKPLERVLALRPLFFRLLKSGGCQREVIGPRVAGQRAGQGGDAQWLEWKIVAQSAVLALGDRERLCVLTYIKLCIERRGGTSWLETEFDGGDQFPGLLDSKTGTSAIASRTEKHLDCLHRQSQDQHFPVLGNQTAPVINARSDWARPRREWRSNGSRWPVHRVTQQTSKHVGKKGGQNFQRETQALAHGSKAVDSWEELASEEGPVTEGAGHAQMEASTGSRL